MDYKRKAKDSFKTKLNLFLFYNIINDIKDICLLEFVNFRIDRHLVDLYTTEYWQELKDYQIKNKEIGIIEQEINKIKDEQKYEIMQLEKHYVAHFEEIFPQEKFNRLISVDYCHYCKITKQEIESLGEKHKLRKKNFRGWSLEIDRLDSNLEYTEKNCVMACYWCNNAKTDEFSESEFLEIAVAINRIWNKRLNNNN